jgi:hypothetical protein
LNVLRDVRDTHSKGAWSDLQLAHGSKSNARV